MSATQLIASSMKAYNCMKDSYFFFFIFYCDMYVYIACKSVNGSFMVKKNLSGPDSFFLSLCTCLWAINYKL